MVRKQRVPAESGEMACPSCGAAIKMLPSVRRRRVQCPKCREVVSLEGVPEKQSETAAEAPPAPDTAAMEGRNRVDMLEARVEALEAALRDLMEASRAGSAGPVDRKLQWVTSD